MQEATFSMQELQENMDRKYARMATNDSDEVQQQLLADSESSIDMQDNPELQRLNWLQDQVELMQDELDNLQILETQYGISIPDSDLKHLNVDQDLLDMYMEDKINLEQDLEKSF